MLGSSRVDDRYLLKSSQMNGRAAASEPWLTSATANSGCGGTILPAALQRRRNATSGHFWSGAATVCFEGG